MLVFVATDDHQYTFRAVLETRDHPLAGHVLLLSWGDFLSWDQLPAADYVFVDLERLPEALLVAAAARLAALEAVLPGLRVLNRPSPAMGRLQVMRRLHASGTNDFRVLGATEAEALAPGDLHFPVFVRRIDDHDGPMSALIEDALALQDAIAAARAAGRGEALAVTEYVDARNANGYHEKLSYFRIGARLFPSALDVSRHWVCKGVVGDPDGIDDHAREQAFLSGNPHADLLAPAFEAAGISYGRADYAMIGGRPQVFEINTNPLIDCPEAMPPELQPYAQLLVGRWLEALAAFSPPGARPAWVRVPGARAAGPTAGGHRLRRTVRRLLRAIGQLHQETRMMRPLRAAGIAR